MLSIWSLYPHLWDTCHAWEGHRQRCLWWEQHVCLLPFCTVLYRFRHLPVSIYPLGKVTLDRLAESFESSQPFPDTVYNKDMGTRAWLYVGGPLASVPRACSQGWSLIMLDEHPTVHGSHLPLMQSPSDLTAWHLSECHLPCDSQDL